MAVDIRPVARADHQFVVRLLTEHWASTRIVSRGRVHEADKLPGFIARSAGEHVGLVTYRIDGRECELITLNSLLEGKGVGTALLDAVRRTAVLAECRRIFLITTNDNTPALRFYQKRGFVLVAVRCNAIEASRRLKPQIPVLGMDGIPIRDEIELEVLL